MMKQIKVLLVSILLLSGVSLYAQTEYSTEYEVQYDVSYSIDSLNLDRKTEETVYLFTGSDYGVFMDYNTANHEKNMEELQRQIQSGRVDMRVVKKPTNFSKQFYKNRRDNQLYVTSNIGSATYSYRESAIPLSWDISGKTKKFLDYQVQKATTSFAGRDYEAWFAVEIPINDGPYIFYGLPGLIVELYDTERHYHFALRSIEKMENVKTWEIPGTKLLTKQKYQEIIDTYNKNKSLSGLSVEGSNGTVARMGIFKNAQGQEISEAEFRRARKKNEESKNNPIELK